MKYLTLLLCLMVRPAFANIDFDHSHRAWTAVLQKSVRISGQASTVDYKRLKGGPTELQEYLNAVSAVSSEAFSRFSEGEKLAFLINSYNAFTVKLIIDHYPVKSIKDIGSILTSPWKLKFFTLLGEQRSLDNIEHDMIRKWFNEPKIHFAVVCASIGCPALRDEAYVASEIDKQLDAASMNFLSDRSRNRYLPDSKKLEISSIFKWYGGDFVKKFGSLEAFLADRVTDIPEQQRIIREKKAALSYLEYDWLLNDQK